MINNLKQYIMQVFELTPTNGRKSFGGKAKVIVENGVAKLLSYTTFAVKTIEEINNYKNVLR